MHVTCDECRSTGEAGLPEHMPPGFLACPACGAVIARVNVKPWSAWIETHVDRLDRLQTAGRLGTRKQSRRQSDRDIDRDGVAAELAACLVICPTRLDAWMRATERGGNNRGRDLPASLTGLDRPVEVKQTRFRTAGTGFLIVRPPRWTPGAMCSEYLDDSYYVLVTGAAEDFRVEGWLDRQGLLSRGRLNPIPCQRGQRQCWGVHWLDLYSIRSLAGRIVVGGPA